MKLALYYARSNQTQKGDTWLFLATWLVLIASYLLKPVGWQAIKLPNGQILPSFSLVHLFTKIPGPTCGLTRSFVNMAHLKLGDAFRSHFLGPFLFLGLLLAIFYFTYRILGGRRRVIINWSKNGLRITLATGIILFLGAWIAKLALGFY